jgi:hypothetical protein
MEKVARPLFESLVREGNSHWKTSGVRKEGGAHGVLASKARQGRSQSLQVLKKPSQSERKMVMAF